MQSTLVTGGAGFLGSHVVERLDGTVHVVDDFHTGRPEYVPEGATLHEADITDRDAIAAVVEAVRPDRVVHLAAIHFIPECNAHPERAFDVNVMGTRHLLDALRESPPDVLVFASSAAVYAPGDGPHHEDETPGPTDIYGRTKLVGEDLCRLFAADTGVPTGVARLFNLYGPRETNPHLVPDVLAQLDAASIELGNLDPARDFVHVTDAARAIVRLLDHDDGYRAYNVGTGVEYTVEQVAQLACEAAARPPAITQDPDRVRRSDRPHLRADVSRIGGELGWEPAVTFTDGLRALL